MADNDTFMRFLASWALVHETADEGWKAAVQRGAEGEPGAMTAGPESFVDGLSAMIAEEKERLKRELASGEVSDGEKSAGISESLDAVRFELAALRGRVESLQASVDALAPSAE